LSSDDDADDADDDGDDGDRAAWRGHAAVAPLARGR